MPAVRKNSRHRLLHTKKTTYSCKIPSKTVFLQNFGQLDKGNGGSDFT